MTHPKVNLVGIRSAREEFYLGKKDKREEELKFSVAARRDQEVRVVRNRNADGQYRDQEHENHHLDRIERVVQGAHSVDIAQVVALLNDRA